MSSRAVSRTATRLALAAALGACFDPTFRGSTCGPAGECPGDLVCIGGPGGTCAAPTPQIDRDAGASADGDVGPPCDRSSPWDDIRPVDGVNTDGDEMAATLSADQLTIVFTRGRAGGIDLRVADRRVAEAAFDDSLVVDTGLDLDETRPSLSADGLRLYFHAWDESFQIVATDRDDRGAAFPRAAALGVPVNSIAQERDPYAMPDGLYFARDGALVRFIDGEGVLPVSNVTGRVEHPTVRGDERELFYAARVDRIPDVWVALRTSDHLAFQESTIAVGLDQDGDGQDLPDWISADGCRIYFSSDRPGGAGGFDIWEARRAAR